MKVIRDREGVLDLGEILRRPLFAHLATASEAGPRSSPVWFLWDDEAVWIIGSRRDDSFPGRIERDGRCALSIVDFDRATGRVEHVGMRGEASIEPFDPARAVRLLERYLGRDRSRWDERFRATLADADNVLIRFVPETAVVRDVSYSAGG